MNIQQMMKQAQSMQKKMLELQEQNDKVEYEGQAGGGLVKLLINGKGELKKIDIDQSILTPADKELISDLILAAFSEAKKKSDNANQETLSSNFGGMLPPGFKFPF